MIGKKIVFVACCEYGVNILEFLIKNGININCLVGVSQEQAIKNNISGYFNYKELCLKYNIPYYNAQRYDLKAEEDLEFFKVNNFDLLLLGGWQRLIPNNILQELNIGGIGVHGSSEFLPKGRGRSPINWSLIENKKRFIVHLFMMKPEADNGDIVDFNFFDINDYDDCETLYMKLSIVTKKLYLNNIDKLLSNNYKLIKQIGEPSYYPKRTPDDGKISWRKDVFEINNFIRALTKPYPGAFTYINNKRINIWKSQVFDTRISYYGCSIGEVVELFENNNFIVNCNSGLLLITEYEGVVNLGDIFINE